MFEIQTIEADILRERSIRLTLVGHHGLPGLGEEFRIFNRDPIFERVLIAQAESLGQLHVVAMRYEIVDERVTGKSLARHDQGVTFPLAFGDGNGSANQCSLVDAARSIPLGLRSQPTHVDLPDEPIRLEPDRHDPGSLPDS